MDYCSAAEVKTYLDISGSGDDTLIGDLITAASRWLDDETHRTLAHDADTTVYIDAYGEHIDGTTLWISDFGDLCAITTITNGDSAEVTSAQYTTYPKTVTSREPTFKRIKILASSGKYWTFTDDWESSITIEGRWSVWATVPDQLNHHAKRLAAYAYRQKDAQVFDTIAIPDAGVITAPAGFPVDVARFVRTWRKL